MDKKLTTQETHRGLSINTNAEKNQACYADILDKHHAHLADMTQKHSKVIQVRFDLRYPQDGSVVPSAQHLHDFNYNFQRKLKRENHSGGHLVDPRIITVTEQCESENPHIHGVLLVNGNAKRSYYPLVQEIEKQWKTALKTNRDGLVDYCDRRGKNGIMIDRSKEDFGETMNQCSHQASYLAKARGKENKLKGSWLVSGTRVPKHIK